MAERRMISQVVIGSDAFLSLPHATQTLYMHLMIHADDEGFVNNAERIARMINVPVRKIQELSDAGFVIQFPTKVIVITHWFLHNYVRAARVTETAYINEKSILKKTKNRIYILTEEGMEYIKNSFSPSAETVQDVQNSRTPCTKILCTEEMSTDEMSTDEMSTDEVSTEERREDVKQIFAENVFLTKTERTKLDELYGTDKAERLIQCLSEWKKDGKSCRDDFKALTDWVLAREQRETAQKTPKERKNRPRYPNQKPVDAEQSEALSWEIVKNMLASQA